MATIGSILSSVRDALFWAPDWLSGVVVLLIAVAAALLAHRVIFMVFGRAFGDRHPVLRTIVWQIKGPLALALIAFALAAALQTTPFSPPVSVPLGRLLLIAFIVLAGSIRRSSRRAGTMSRSRPEAASISGASRSSRMTTCWRASTSRKCVFSSARCTP